MTKSIKFFFETNFPGITPEEACQSMIDELAEMETHTAQNTETIREFIETILADFNDSYETETEYDYLDEY